jgi:uncharacterized protein YjdB
MNVVFEITVTSTDVPVTEVTLNKSSADIRAGGTEQLIATILPANATNKNVKWSSSNIAVATVNASGLVTCISGGKAIITVSTEDGGYTATFAVNGAGSGSGGGCNMLNSEMLGFVFLFALLRNVKNLQK